MTPESPAGPVQIAETQQFDGRWWLCVDDRRGLLERWGGAGALLKMRDE